MSDPGPKGDQGVTGAAGAPGRAGSTGAEGAAGSTGVTGTAGAAGAAGAKGVAGEQGEQGDIGGPGAQGKQGERGKTGYLVGKALVVRDFWLACITLAVFLALGLGYHNIGEVKSGRRTGTAITCVITEAVLEGSHAFIVTSGSTPLPPKLEKSLLAQGYPPLSKREEAALRQADAYTAAIERRVEQAAKPAKGLVRPNGELNCALLKRITKVQ